MSLQFQDWEGNWKDAPQPGGKLHFSYADEYIRLFEADDNGPLTLCYGFEVKTFDRDDDAAKALGEAMFHHLGLFTDYSNGEDM